MKRIIAALTLVLTLNSAARADDFVDFAGISPTTTLENNHLCYSDGRDIACSDRAMYLLSDGSVSATAFIGDGAGLTNLNLSDVAVDRIVSDTTSIIANDGMDTISFTTAGVERMMIDSNGNVGIGTDNPNVALGVSGTIDSNTSIRVTPETGSFWTLISPETNLFSVQSNGINILNLLSSSGNVGIGTTAPTTALHVSGTLRIADGGETAADAGAGAIKYDSGDLFYSDGSTWSALASTATTTTTISDNDGDTSITLMNAGDTDTISFTTAGTERMVIDSSGNVGIGISTPDATLHAVDNTHSVLKAQSASDDHHISLDSGHSGFDATRILTSRSSVRILTDNVNEIARFSNTRQIFYNNGAEFMRISNMGRLGIGTTAPNTALDVSGTLRIADDGETAADAGAGAIKYDSGDLFYSNGSAWLTLADSTDIGTVAVDRIVSDTTSIIANDGMDTISFTTAGTERMVITANGNVGIGTTSPSSGLYVETDYPQLSLGAATQAGGIRFARGDDGAISGYIGYTDASEARDFEIFSQGGFANLEVGAQNYVAFKTGATRISATERMRITSNGNVGIGTTAPSGSLHISHETPRVILTDTGTSGSSRIDAESSLGALYIDADHNDLVSNSILGLGVDGTRHMYIDSSGHIGIGTASPNSKLDILGGDLFLTAAENDVGDILFRENDGDQKGRIWTAVPADDFRLHLSSGDNTPDITINADGNVGIGTEAPSETLHVAGSINASKQSINFNAGHARTSMDIVNATKIGRIGTITGGETLTGNEGDLSILTRNIPRMHIKGSSGNVGLGTSAPAALLDVVSSTTAVAVARFENGTGACTFTPAASGSGTWSCSSDERLKKDITPAGSALEQLNQFAIKDYTMKADNSRQTGVIAQEVQNIFPEMISQDNDGTLMVAEPGVWQLVKATQELSTENDALKAQLSAIETRLQALEAQ